MKWISNVEVTLSSTCNDIVYHDLYQYLVKKVISVGVLVTESGQSSSCKNLVIKTKASQNSKAVLNQSDGK